MTLISTSGELAAFCQRQAASEYITVDTEFLRDKTYWPQLCLVQIASEDEAVAIDTLVPGIDLAPLFRLMADPAVLKVFHAARQDIEIFVNMMGSVPAPLFDTQVAAMVCGFGDSASYETLAGRLADAKIDKTSRFTDWANRPLSARQMEYAIADVTHLRMVYQKLRQQLDASGRENWLVEEMSILLDPNTYRTDPDEAWRRLKPRSGNRRFLSVLKSVANWRESAAQSRDIPRNRVLRDEALLEIAAHPPATIDELGRIRGFGRAMAEGKLGTEILAAVAGGVAAPEESAPILPPRVDLPNGIGPLVDLLRVLLKLRCEERNVAQKLVASSADLELIAASDDADTPALTGWRAEIFGHDALLLKRGKVALTARGKRIQVVKLD